MTSSRIKNALMIVFCLLAFTLAGLIVHKYFQKLDDDDSIPSPVDPADLGPGLVGGVMHPEQRARLVREVLESPPVQFDAAREPTPAESKEFGRLFDGLMERIKGGDPNTQPYFHFDFDRYVRERIRVCGWGDREPILSQSRLDKWVGLLHVEIEARFSDDESKYIWDESRILRLTPSKNGDEAILIVRHNSKAQPQPRIEEWRVKKAETGEWKIYDYADTPLWIRRSVAWSDSEAGTTTLKGKGEEPDEKVGTLTLALALTTGPKPDLLDKSVALTRGVKLPPALDAVRSYCEGMIRLKRGSASEALPFFDAAVKFDSTWPLPYAGRSAALNALNKPEEALLASRETTARAGPWPPAVAEEVAALKKLGRNSEAEDVAKAAEAVYPATK